MNKNGKVLILGGRGLVGSAISRQLITKGYTNVHVSSRNELNLLDQSSVYDYFENERPEYVFLAAAKVGGIKANNEFRADFIFENLTIQNNVFGAAWKFPVKRLLFLGSTCIYPKDCPQPIKEEYLLTGPLESTNEPYAIAKIAGLKMAESFRRQYGCEFYSVMPTNLYGPGDNYHPENSHVIPGLINRMHAAKISGDKVFEAWGTGNPMREFLFVDDMAQACVHIMEYEGEIPELLNIGTGKDITNSDLVYLIKDVVDFKGEIVFDSNKPDGTMRKVTDVTKLNSIGWKAEVNLREGLKIAYQDFLENYIPNKNEA
jgi:GDP-L-fucose synthase